MKKQNLLVLAVVIALVAAVAVLAAVIPQPRTISENAPSVIPIELPADTEQPSEPNGVADGPETVPAATEEAPSASASTEAETADAQPIEAYLVMSVRGSIYEPLPLAGEGTFTIKQDESTTNTVHVTPTSVWMEHSSCDNQDCVEQGIVSLENMGSRVLYNMIICLPNEVVLELHTPETLADAFGLTQSLQ